MTRTSNTPQIVDVLLRGGHSEPPRPMVRCRKCGAAYPRQDWMLPGNLDGCGACDPATAAEIRYLRHRNKAEARR